MIELKSPAEIDRMHTTGRFVAQILSELSELADVGVNLLDLEHHARRRIRRRGAQSCYWDYAPSFGNGPFRNVVCLSVNDAVLHGLPHDYALRDGDILSMDLAVGIDGWVADAARTVIVGTPATRTCDFSVRPRKRSRSASRPRGRATGWATSRRRSRRSPPATATRSTRSSAATGSDERCTRIPTSPTRAAPAAASLRAGMTLALEPWFARTTDRIVFDPDGWTIRSADGSRTAHSEHTIAITEDGPLVLTQRPPHDAADWPG